MTRKFLLISTLSLMLFACNKKENQEVETTTQETTEATHTMPETHKIEGIYKGTLPCASCPGIETTLEILDNNTFKRTEVYLEKENEPIVVEGSFDFENDRDFIVLKLTDGSTAKYKVDANQLMMTDANGNAAGELADKYILKKVQ